MTKIAKISVTATMVLLITLVSCNKDNEHQECISFRMDGQGGLYNDNDKGGRLEGDKLDAALKTLDSL